MKTDPETICRITGASSVRLGQEIQSVWSGYGVILRAELAGLGGHDERDPVPVVIKHVDTSRARANRRGWGSDFAHQRKVHSYQVERRFYDTRSAKCDQLCLIPNLIAAHDDNANGIWMIVLQDLDAAGFDRRKHRVNQQELAACLSWLANFHATFLGDSASGLWPVGTYWHLETRPEELASMREGRLKQHAELIDRRLSDARYQTLVHGDAKIANFCFSDRSPDQVAAVDFQYVGRGCGIKDVAYFVSSCLDENEAAARQEALLAFYFQQLQSAIAVRDIRIDFSKLEAEWRELYPFAWADFCRFLSGWSPEHWKLNGYSGQMTEAALAQLEIESRDR